MKKNLSILCITFLLISCSTNYKTNKDFSYARTTYLEDGVEYSLNMQTLYRNSGIPHLSSTSKNILVVPLGFTDENLVNIQTQENITKLTKAFNSDDSNFQSVKSYYQKSSYGKVNLNADIISNWLIYDGTSKEFQQQYKLETLGLGACEYIQKKYKEEFSKENHGLLGNNAKDLSYYDQDNDGFIDFIWIIYSQTSDQIPSSDWWAYVSYTQNKFKENETQIQTFGFASIDWLNHNNGYDTHTYIHETGHAFGLVDYYDYNNHWSPLGKIDMMDSSIGDHNAFSKFTLGWLSPLVVDSTSEITLRSTSLFGDCFIIPSPNYNNTAFDEYIMVEFLTQEGLNEEINELSSPGIRLTHCDGRVFNTNHDEYLLNPQEGTSFRVSNTYRGRSGIKEDSDYFSNEDKKYYSLISLIENNIQEKNCLNNYSFSLTNNSLFKKGDYIDFTNLKGYQKDYFPSNSNLWNKAKTITGWKNNSMQNQEIDEKCSINYSIEIKDIYKIDNQYEAKILVTKK